MAPFPAILFAEPLPMVEPTFGLDEEEEDPTVDNDGVDNDEEDAAPVAAEDPVAEADLPSPAGWSPGPPAGFTIGSNFGRT